MLEDAHWRVRGSTLLTDVIPWPASFLCSHSQKSFIQLKKSKIPWKTWFATFLTTGNTLPLYYMTTISSLLSKGTHSLVHPRPFHLGVCVCIYTGLPKWFSLPTWQAVWLCQFLLYLNHDSLHVGTATKAPPESSLAKRALSIHSSWGSCVWCLFGSPWWCWLLLLPTTSKTLCCWVVKQDC